MTDLKVGAAIDQTLSSSARKLRPWVAARLVLICLKREEIGVARGYDTEQSVAGCHPLHKFLQKSPKKAEIWFKAASVTTQEHPMGYHSYLSWRTKASPVQIPHAKRKAVSWFPQLDEIFPNFSASTTQGPLNFWDWAEGSWVHLFCEPDLSGSICTGEMVEFAKKSEAWAEKGVKLLALSDLTLAEHSAWQRDLKQRCGCDIDFPVVADEKSLIADALGMRQQRPTSVSAIRRSFLIAPNLKIRMMLDYPVMVERNPDEILRVIEALKKQDRRTESAVADLMLN